MKHKLVLCQETEAEAEADVTHRLPGAAALGCEGPVHGHAAGGATAGGEGAGQGDVVAPHGIDLRRGFHLYGRHRGQHWEEKKGKGEMEG